MSGRVALLGAGSLYAHFYFAGHASAPDRHFHKFWTTFMQFGNVDRRISGCVKRSVGFGLTLGLRPAFDFQNVLAAKKKLTWGAWILTRCCLERHIWIIWSSNHREKKTQLPFRSCHNFRAPQIGDQINLSRSGKPCNGFLSSEAVKGSSGMAWGKPLRKTSHFGLIALRDALCISDVKMEIPVLVRSLKSSILSSTSLQMGETFWKVASAAVEKSRRKANMRREIRP